MDIYIYMVISVIKSLLKYLSALVLAPVLGTTNAVFAMDLGTTSAANEENVVENANLATPTTVARADVLSWSTLKGRTAAG